MKRRLKNERAPSTMSAEDFANLSDDEIMNMTSAPEITQVDAPDDAGSDDDGIAATGDAKRTGRQRNLLTPSLMTRGRLPMTQMNRLMPVLRVMLVPTTILIWLSPKLTQLRLLSKRDQLTRLPRMGRRPKSLLSTLPSRIPPHRPLSTTKPATRRSWPRSKRTAKRSNSRILMM